MPKTPALNSKTKDQHHTANRETKHAARQGRPEPATRDTEEQEEPLNNTSKPDKKWYHIQEVPSFIIGVLTFVVVSIYTGYARQQVIETQTANGIARKSFAEANKPYLVAGGIYPNFTRDTAGNHFRVGFNILRVCPRSSVFLAELSQHEADRCEAEEGESLSVEALPILGQASASVQPGDRPFDDPSLRQDGKALGFVGALDDLDVDPAQYTLQCRLKDRPLVAAVGVELQEEWVEAKQSRHDEDAAVAVLDVGCMHERVQEQALRVYQQMALLALDLLAGIVAWRIDRGPPFSALLTL